MTIKEKIQYYCIDFNLRKQIKLCKVAILKRDNESVKIIINGVICAKFLTDGRLLVDELELWDLGSKAYKMFKKVIENNYSSTNSTTGVYFRRRRLVRLSVEYPRLEINYRSNMEFVDFINV